jgi:hypothetical protein
MMDGGRVAGTLSPWLPAGGLVLGGDYCRSCFDGWLVSSLVGWLAGVLLFRYSSMV